PTLISVKDDKDKDVSKDSSTVSTTLKLVGKASPSQKLEIRNGNDKVGEATANASGDWHTTLTGLPAKAYALKAHGMYGSNPASDAWNVTVVVAVKPIINSVIDDKGKPVPNGGSVMSRSLILSGTASAEQQVQIVDGDNVLKTERVGAGGAWTSPLTGLTLKAYAFKARAVYDTNPESDVWDVLQNLGCEDFSNVPLGRRPDNVWVPLTSMLSMYGVLGSYGSPTARAEIVQVGSAREFQWDDKVEPSGWSRVDFAITDFTTPLEQPVTVTFEYYITDTNTFGAYLWGNYLGSDGKQSMVKRESPSNLGSLSITYPVGAQFHQPSFVQGLHIQFGRNGGTEGKRGVMHLKSVCFS
ncbi:hypothetical protein ACQZ2L_24735, partial [Pseudomonas shirazensis]